MKRRSRRNTSAPRAARRTLLRRIGIGPRLWLFIAIPAVAFVLLVALLVSADVRTVRDLYDYENTTDVVVDLVAARDALQTERHNLIVPDAEGQFTDGLLANDLLGSDVVSLLNRTQSAFDIGDELLTARGLADSDQPQDALDRYSNLIAVVDNAIDVLLTDAPTGEIDQRGDALRSLLIAQEAVLVEDLDIQLGSATSLSVTRAHTVEVESLRSYAQRTSESGFLLLEEATITSAWSQTNLLRQSFLDAPQRGVDLDAWSEAALARQTAFDELVQSESTALHGATSLRRQEDVGQLITLGALVTAVLIVSALAAFAIRRSIVQPLNTIATAASEMSKGSLEPVEDIATDEIAKVAQAFSSLHHTMDSLWTDVYSIEQSVRRNEYDQRVDTAELQGDWRRLADTMNETLETSQLHSESVQAELLRRRVLAEISGASLTAESGPALTALVLRTLPNALPDSHVHIHRHPSGPPIYDLGIPLEPSISALELPSLFDDAQVVDLTDGNRGVASLVDFGEGPPAVLVLTFGSDEPDDPGPLMGMVEMAARVLAQGHRRQVAEWSATHNLEHDALTGLPNATGLSTWIAKQPTEARAVIGVQPLRLGRLDSTDGRQARNALLNIVARRLHPLLGEGDLLTRIGDPEFAIVTSTATADDLIRRIAAAFEHPLAVGHDLVAVQLGIGIAAVTAEISESIANASTAIRHGDDYNTSIVYFEDRLREVDVRHEEIERWLEGALAAGELAVHFQPVVNAVTTAVEGYECLIRGSRNGVSVSPAEFVPIAEQSSIILDIGDLTLREGCAALAFLPGDDPYVAVNLSPAQLSDPELLDRIDSILTAAGVDRSRIVMEITEGVMTSEDDIELLHRIRGLGVRIAIDDFGSGHSNLAYLTNMPADIVKLDRSLVTPMTHDKNAHTVVAGAIAMAHEIGLKVVGEGVESNDELNALRRVRCDLVQGWLTGRPAPLSDLVDVSLLEDNSTDRTRIVQPESA